MSFNNLISSSDNYSPNNEVRHKLLKFVDISFSIFGKEVDMKPRLVYRVYMVNLILPFEAIGF